VKKSAQQSKQKIPPELLNCIPPQYRQYLTDESEPPSILPSARREEPRQTPKEKVSFLLDYIGNLVAKRILTVEKELKDAQQRLSFLTTQLESEKRQTRRVDKTRLLALCSIQKEEQDLAALLSQLQGAQGYLPSPYIVPEHPTWDDYIELLHALRHILGAFGAEAITNAMAGVKRKHQNQEKSIEQTTSREGVQLAEKLQKERGISPWAAAGQASKITGTPRSTIANALSKKSNKNKQ
jgi:hypothetical protein